MQRVGCVLESLRGCVCVYVCWWAHEYPFGSKHFVERERAYCAEEEQRREKKNSSFVLENLRMNSRNSIKF